MLKKLLGAINTFFAFPTLREAEPALHARSVVALDDTTKHQNNVENISLAELQLQREALLKSLRLQHVTMLITLLAVLISLALGIYAVSSKPSITVRPNIDVKVNK